MRRAIGERDLEDHVQDVFVGLYENLSRLRDPTALRSFIFGIALRVAGSELRRRGSRWWLTLTLTGGLPEPHAVWIDATDAREVLRSFFAIVCKLGAEGGRAFQLRYVENRELKQVARLMNASLTTTKRRLGRASVRFLAMAERDPVLTVFLRRWPIDATSTRDTKRRRARRTAATLAQFRAAVAQFPSPTP
jgi:RNA polymerase sigma-70 factor (ECF subfamily)